MGNISMNDSCRYYELQCEDNTIFGICKKFNSKCNRCEEREWNFRDITIKNTKLKKINKFEAREIEEFLQKYNIKYEAKDMTNLFG